MAASSDIRANWQAAFPHEQMVEDILSGRLAPGSKIDFADLMRRYFVSTADLHEAIIRLSNEGLAVLDGPTALRISPVSVADLKDLTAARVLIETDALVRSIQAGGAAWEAGVSESYANLADIDCPPTGDARPQVEAWERRNHRFHTALIAACPVRRLKDFSELLYRQHERYRRLLADRRLVSQDVHAEHHALFAAALAGDAERAAQGLREHIRLSAETLADGIADGSWFGSPTRN
ncbi:MAG TPA: GntR family transcriptional regulator [Patescibacteria group bacterium]|nr:GntR family transcriptional regulator [Patescibacteria group bacterium]